MVELQDFAPSGKLTYTEKLSQLFGKHVLLPALDLLSNRTEKFDITTEGLENLALNTPCIFASNHLKPESAVAAQSQLSPDAFVIQRVVKEAIGVSPRIVAKAGDGWWSSNSLYRAFQKKSLPVVQKAVESAGLIPVIKNPGVLNRNFLRSFDQAVKVGSSFLIFPEGNWYPDYDLNNPLNAGAAHLATKYALPIIPVYIHGATDWKKGQRVYISFGKTIKPTSNQQQITGAIRSEIARMQSNFRGVTADTAP